MNILITGGAGFIGSFLVDYFLEKGYNVICIDNFFRGSRTNIDKAVLNKQFRLYDYDLTDINASILLNELIKTHNIEAVFHLAAVNGTEYFYDASFKVLNDNILMTQNIISALDGTQVQYVMYASSSEVYGDPIIIPTPENHRIILNSYADRDSYASSKAIGDFYFRLFSEKSKIPTTIVRFFNQYGPRMVKTKYGQVIAEFIQRCRNEDVFTILGDGSHTRSFCYIDDSIKILDKLFDIKFNGVINVGNTHEISIGDLALLIHQIYGRKFEPKYLPARPNDHSRRCPDISLLKSVVPELIFTNLEDGLRLSANYYDAI